MKSNSFKLALIQNKASTSSESRSGRASARRSWIIARKNPVLLIETFADTKVIGLTINHEHMTDDQVSVAIDQYRRELSIPVTDALTRPASRLVDMVVGAFPELAAKRTKPSQ